MGRPRKKDDISAPVKIENAFWQLLGIESYSNMTIQKLADAAGVNRNAVYYHYENVDDVAKNALHNFLQKDIVDGFIRQMIGGVGKDSFMKIDEAYMPVQNSMAVSSICVLMIRIRQKKRRSSLNPSKQT